MAADRQPVRASGMEVSSGRFRKGSPLHEPKAYDEERPTHEVEVRPFYLGCYPVTNQRRL